MIGKLVGMKAVFVLFDSLNRHALQSYDGAIETPNFQRFSNKAVTFDAHYVGSLPCMPARRDLHTGRLNFMHRSWGPLEPFDNSFAEIMSGNGIHTHLISDHFHYFEDGGATYHTRFDTWEFIRGQEYDPWVAMIEPPLERFRRKYSPKHYKFDRSDKKTQSAINREKIVSEEDFPGVKCFDAALDYLDLNHAADNWFLQVECFDPHEPFAVPDRFYDQFLKGYEGPLLDWPAYERVTESAEEVAIIRSSYAALVALCDYNFGRLLSAFDRYNLWEDTVLVLSTDHGYLLAEHDWWAKSRMPYYEELSHIPLVAYHPNFDRPGERRKALTQTPDLMPTFLDCFGLAAPKETLGRSLLPLIDRDSVNERSVIFGIFGGPIGVTDGRWVLYHYPPDTNAPGLHEYTLMPTHMSAPFEIKELQTTSLAPPFKFTKGAPLLKIDALSDARRVPMNDGKRFADCQTQLFDLASDPRQERPLDEPEVLRRLYAAMFQELAACEAPPELYGWYRLPGESDNQVATASHEASGAVGIPRYPK